VQSRPNLILRGYFEQAWGVQDIVVLYKKTGFNQPWLAGGAATEVGTDRRAVRSPGGPGGPALPPPLPAPDPRSSEGAASLRPYPLTAGEAKEETAT